MRHTKAKGARFDVAAHCFDAQRPFATSKAKFRTASCSRRAGKTDGSAATLLEAVQAKPGSVGLYITKTRINAKRIIWKTLKQMNAQHGLGGIAREAELCLELPNGSSIYLLGANNRDEIEKFRGLPIAIVVLDEAQILTDLETLVDVVLVPALMDFDGAVVLVGTPAPVPVGYFWDAAFGKHAAQWEHHSWTCFENPWLQKKSGKSPQQHLDEELKRRGVTVDEPSIQREWFGRWVYDPNALVFRYEAGRNHFDDLPSLAHGEWECVIGGDLGWDDADALCVLKWNTTRPDLWLTEEQVLPKQSITELGNRLRELVDRHQPLATVLDFGGLGKKIAQELTQRWSLKVEPAEKERKLEHIELLNDSMRSGVFHAKKDSQYAKDCMLVEWDKSKPEKWKISERFHSDVCDAVLYAHRRAKQWLATPEEEPAPRPGSTAWQEAQVSRQRAQIAAYWQKRDEEALARKREQEALEGDMWMHG